MTHVPDCETHDVRRGKILALCGAEVSVRKAVTYCPGCPECATASEEAAADVWAGKLSLVQWSEIMSDRSGYIRLRKAWARRRRRAKKGEARQW